ncbi:hypothetical protein [Roseivirga sp.]|uniref:hypothetical protein n=1 Tax=Roseivirga sp. TaxID=1964215 RepID=UPI003B526696
MKNIKISQSVRSAFKLIFGLLIVLTIASCGGGGDDTPTPPEETPQEIAQALLENNWTVASGGSISLDGSDVSNRYDGFSLDIENGTFTTTNAGDLFPATGTWQWVGTTDNQVTTGNGKSITITELSTTRFVFSFLKTDQNVAAGVPGNYVVTLTR